MLECEIGPAGELLGAVGDRDAHARSEPRGLDHDRVAERVRHPVPMAGEGGDIPRHRDPLVAHHRLEEVLVHAQRRGGHARADVGDACELEEPLDGAVLAEGPVQHREDDVHLAERLDRPPVGRNREAAGRAAVQLACDPAPSSQTPSRPISISRTS